MSEYFLLLFSVLIFALGPRSLIAGYCGLKNEVENTYKPDKLQSDGCK